jgi:sporulation protein YabP
VFILDEMVSQSQNIIIENRKKLNISGVKEVISFDDETILLDTVLGKITVKGEGLHILSFNTEGGDLDAEGMVHATVYMSDAKSQGGFLSKLFR